jgi:RNA polymerase sigma-70 factor (ECF subfamily)
MMTIEEIYSKYNTQVFNAVRQMVGNYHDAEDVTQMIFTKVNRLLPTFDDSKSAFTTWLHTITKTVVLDFFRTNHQDRYTAVSDFQTKDGNDVFEFNAPERANHRVESQEIRAEILKAINGLKPNYQKVAILFFQWEYSYEEISKILNLPLGSVKGMISRCRTILQEQLSDVYRMA